jgi:hypothetical protein
MRRYQTAIVTLALALVGAACSSTVDADIFAATTDLAEGVARLQTSLDHTSTEIEAVAVRADAASTAMGSFVASAEIHVIDRTAGIPDPPEGKVAVRMSAAYIPEALPGAGVQAYVPLAEVSAVWAMESLGSGVDVPVGSLIPDQTVFITPGETVAVTLAFVNTSEAQVRFMALPHQDSPGGLNAMIWPQCLCFSFPYEASGGGAWYRVIELTASPSIPVGSKVDILWTYLTDDSVFPKK